MVDCDELPLALVFEEDVPLSGICRVVVS